MAKIEPTVGRKLHFYSYENGQHAAVPLSADLAAVNADGTINLMVISAEGFPGSRTGVQLVQEGEDVPLSHYATWIPYQRGQAAKTQEMEGKIAEQSNNSTDNSFAPIGGAQEAKQPEGGPAFETVVKDELADFQLMQRSNSHEPTSDKQ